MLPSTLHRNLVSSNQKPRWAPVPGLSHSCRSQVAQLKDCVCVCVGGHLNGLWGPVGLPPETRIILVRLNKVKVCLHLLPTRAVLEDLSERRRALQCTFERLSPPGLPSTYWGRPRPDVPVWEQVFPGCVRSIMAESSLTELFVPRGPI